MLQSIRKRLSANEDGFTLIELMVVVLIIAILIAIAVPTFLGATKRASERAGQSDLRNAYTAAKTIYADQESFGDGTAGVGASASGLQSAEPSLTFAEGPQTAVDTTVYVLEHNGDNFMAVRYVKKSATYFGLGANTGGTVVKCKSTSIVAWTAEAGANQCTGGW